MRTLIIFLAMVCTAQFTEAQIVSAQLKAGGLTCSLCSRSVEMALQKLEFVKSVSMDLETTQAEIEFKAGSKIVVQELADAVEKAGFSVAALKISGTFNESVRTGDRCFTYQDQIFQLLENTSTLHAAKPVTLTIIGKEYMSKDNYKKWKDLLPVSCAEDKRLHYYVAL